MEDGFANVPAGPGATHPWRVVSVASDDTVATIAFRDPDARLRQAMENALAATSWDRAQDILAAALSGAHKGHELSGECWCGPIVERVDTEPRPISDGLFETVGDLIAGKYTK